MFIDYVWLSFCTIYFYLVPVCSVSILYGIQMCTSIKRKLFKMSVLNTYRIPILNLPNVLDIPKPCWILKIQKLMCLSSIRFQKVIQIVIMFALKKSYRLCIGYYRILYYLKGQVENIFWHKRDTKLKALNII